MNKRVPRTYGIIGAAMKVNDELGCGFLEAINKEALALEFLSRVIPYRREVVLPILDKHQRLARTYKAAFICYESVVV